MGGVDLQDCSFRWLVAPSCRRFLGVRHPAPGVPGVYLFLPFGLGPSLGWKDKAALAAAGALLPQSLVVDFADDIRFVGASGERDALAVGMAGVMSLLDQMGVGYHAKGGKRWWPARSMP